MAKEDKKPAGDKKPAAKNTTKTEGKTDTKTKDKAKEEAPQFGIEYLAKALDIKPASVRVQLRNKEIKKPGARWAWASKEEADKVIAKLKKADA